MGDWVVETPSFEEQLMNNRIIGLNKKGVDNVVIIIKRKNNEINILHNKLKMIKDNIDTITKEDILDIIDNYTGFFGKDSDE